MSSLQPEPRFSSCLDPIRVHELRREPPSYGLAGPSMHHCMAAPGQCMIRKEFEKDSGHGIGGCVCSGSA